MVRLWSWEAFAHGAGCVSYFRWRQCPFAQEQLHAGLNTPDNQLDVGGAEAAGVARELALLPDSDKHAACKVRARVALIFDYEAKWLFEIHPQGFDFSYARIVFDYYSALRSLGLDVDVIPATAALDGYAMIVVPPLPVLPAGLPARLQESGAHVVFGPRTGSKTVDLRIPDNLPPGPLAAQLPMRVWRVESLRPNVKEAVTSGALPGHGSFWRDLIEVQGATVVEATFADGHPAIVGHERLHYLASVFDSEFTIAYFSRVAELAGLAPQRLPDTVRISRRGALTYVFNYGSDPVTAPHPHGASFIIGTAAVPPQGVSAYR
jgi:beta-galactosidase